MFGGFTLRHVPCDECGASVAKTELERHVCDPDRRLEYQMFRQREELARLESEVGDYFASPRGRFELWYAQRRRDARA